MAYTTIDDPSAHFQIATYTGNGSNGHAITYNGNSDMQPDLLWFKNRDDTNNPTWLDSSRGVTNFLLTNSNQAEQSLSTLLSSFDTDGFTVNSNDNVNGNAEGIVAWGWKANAGSTSSNTSGTITSTVQANTDAGFSIIQYTGTGSTSSTIGHGLGVTPDIIIFKRTDAGTNNWDVQFKGELRLTLNLTDAQATNVLCTFTSTTTNLGSVATGEKNQSGATYIAYAFAEKQGFSKFGKYTGNGSSDGPFVYTGFKPAFVMVKRTNATENWAIIDSTRDPYNLATKFLRPDEATAETAGNAANMDLLSNGFKLRNTDTKSNASSSTYIYMAFAENPFVTSTGIPTTAR